MEIVGLIIGLYPKWNLSSYNWERKICIFLLKIIIMLFLKNFRGFVWLHFWEYDTNHFSAYEVILSSSFP